MLKSSCSCFNLWPDLCVEGPCLIHSMNGDLLRTLDGPEACLRPRLIQSSAEGHCVIYYDRGQFCLFSVNGKLLRHMEVEDSVKVRKGAHICERACTCVSALHQHTESSPWLKARSWVLEPTEVKVGVPRDKHTASHLFFPFHPRTHQEEGLFWSRALLSGQIAPPTLVENIPEGVVSSGQQHH